VAIKSEQIHYGDQTGYLALPGHTTGPMPGVIVIQEVWGVNENIEDITRRIASAGYAALAPDLFAVGGERPAALSRERIREIMLCGSRMPPGTLFNPSTREDALSKRPEPEQTRVRESIVQLFSGLGRMESFVGPLRSAIRYLRTERPETRDQKVACVGFCMGGGLATLLACEDPELAATASFYGTMPSGDRVEQIQCPVMAFFGANDSRVNASIPGFEQAMRAMGKSFEHHIYPGAGHGFFDDSRSSYEVNAARDSYARLLTFFLQHLAGQAQPG
jgi:carboxymethylenebutenolidase